MGRAPEDPSRATAAGVGGIGPGQGNGGTGGWRRGGARSRRRWTDPRYGPFRGDGTRLMGDPPVHGHLPTDKKFTRT